VKEGDTVAVWGLGPIGFFSSFWAFHKGAKRVIAIDNNWRTEYAKSKIKGLETINYKALKSDETVPGKIHELVPGGVDVSIDATGGEYGKGWTHSLELAVGAEQDTSEMVNEAIYATRKFGRVGLIGDYVGCKSTCIKNSVLPKIPVLTGRCSYQPLQHWRRHGAWYHPCRLWAGSCPEM
jgi:threonine dehydrogenase-like Zn-dependent dehydrogenase